MSINHRLPSLIAFTISLMAASPGTSADESATDHADAVRAWRAEHEARFKSPDGWLALVGMVWLEDGSHVIGTTDEAGLRLPAGTAPSTAGTLTVRGDQVEIAAEPDAALTINGEAASTARLTIEPLTPEADSPDKLRIGDRIGLQLVRRSGKLAIRIRDSESPSVKSFTGKAWFPINPAARVEARYTAYDPPKEQVIVNIKGDSSPGKLAGFVTFRMHDHEQRLDVVQESDGGLFITFRDLTSGRSTYGPGRFLDTTRPVDGRVLLDFNQCYSPPCAWSEFTLCPLPPAQNHLEIPIEAGERLAVTAR